MNEKLKPGRTELKRLTATNRWRSASYYIGAAFVAGIYGYTMLIPYEQWNLAHFLSEMAVPICAVFISATAAWSAKSKGPAESTLKGVDTAVLAMLIAATIFSLDPDGSLSEQPMHIWNTVQSVFQAVALLAISAGAYAGYLQYDERPNES